MIIDITGTQEYTSLWEVVDWTDSIRKYLHGKHSRCSTEQLMLGNIQPCRRYLTENISGTVKNTFCSNYSYTQKYSIL